MFWTASLLHESQCKNGRTAAIDAPVHATKLRWKFLQRTHPIHPIGPQTHILEHFGQFCYSMKFGAKRAKLLQLMHKFVPRSRVRIFHNECTWCTPLDPKLMFSSISDHFVTSWTLVQNGPNWCNYCTSSWHEVVSEFFAMNTSDPPNWTPNSCFVATPAISLGHELQCKLGWIVATYAQVRATKSR
jgi:hypothetical protein